MTRRRTHISTSSPTSIRTRARSRAKTRPRRDPAPRGAAPPRRRALGGGGVGALAVVVAGVPPAPPRRARALPDGRPASRAALQQLRAALLAREDRRAARGPRPLRPLRRALDARVRGGADRHRDAARDDRLCLRVGSGAAVLRPEHLVAAPLRALRQLRTGHGRQLVRAGRAVRAPLYCARDRDGPRAS